MSYLTYFSDTFSDLMRIIFGPAPLNGRDSRSGSFASGNSGASGPDAYQDQAGFEGTPNEDVVKFVGKLRDRVQEEQTPSTLKRLAKRINPNASNFSLFNEDAPEGLDKKLEEIGSENETELTLEIKLEALFAVQRYSDYLNHLIITDARWHLIQTSLFVPFGGISVWHFGNNNMEVASTNLALLTNNFKLPTQAEVFFAVNGNMANAVFYRATITEILKQWSKFIKDMQSYINSDFHIAEKILKGFLRILLEIFIITIAFFSAAGDYVMSNGLTNWSYWLVLLFHFLSGISGMYGFKKTFEAFQGRNKNLPLLTYTNIATVIKTLLLTAFFFLAFYPSAVLARESALGSWLVYLTVTIGVGNALLFSHNLVSEGFSIPNPRKDLFGFLFMLSTLFFLGSGNNTYAAATMILIEEDPWPTVERIIALCLTTGIATGALNTAAAVPEFEAVQDSVVIIKDGKSALQNKITRLYGATPSSIRFISNENTPLLDENIQVIYNGHRLPQPKARPICTIL